MEVWVIYTLSDIVHAQAKSYTMCIIVSATDHSMLDINWPNSKEDLMVYVRTNVDNMLGAAF